MNSFLSLGNKDAGKVSFEIKANKVRQQFRINTIRSFMIPYHPSNDPVSIPIRNDNVP